MGKAVMRGCCSIADRLGFAAFRKKTASNKQTKANLHDEETTLLLFRADATY